VQDLLGLARCVVTSQRPRYRNIDKEWQGGNAAWICCILWIDSTKQVELNELFHTSNSCVNLSLRGKTTEERVPVSAEASPDQTRFSGWVHVVFIAINRLAIDMPLPRLAASASVRGESCCRVTI
jgi:hypothetical protein